MAAMWLLVATAPYYLGYGLATGYFRCEILPVGPRSFARHFTAALTCRLGHRLDHYNAVQKAFHLAVNIAVVVSVASGMSIWNPMQRAWLTDAFGAYDTARSVHFAGMAAIMAFLLAHVTLTMLFPRTLLSMTDPGAEAKA